MKKYILIIILLLGIIAFVNSSPLGQGKGEVFVDKKVMFTPEGGLAIRLTNKSGSATVKGYIVETSSITPFAVKFIAVDSVDPLGILYENGVADGQEAWVVIQGIADVYFSTDTALHQFARVMVSGDDNDNEGYAIAEAFPTSPFATDKHFQEIGHVIEARFGEGLAKTIVHFN